MFLCKVEQGATYTTAEERLTEGQVDHLVAERGHGGPHNSVIGLDVVSGGRLNHEETVVYDEAAAIPSYLFVYKLNG